VHWDAVEHLNALGQLNAQALELAPPKTLKHQAPDPPEADESAA
jgi:hypothetical protein